MNSELSNALEALYQARIDFLKQLEQVPRELRSKHPAQGWNMLQVMEHIISSEVGTLEYMKKKTQAPANDIPVAGEESAAGSEQLKRALRSERKWKMPGVLPDPTGAQSFENMQAYWDGLFEKYRSFLEDLDPDYYNRAIFKHPISGRLNLYQTIEFLIDHIVHHGYQVERIKSEFRNKLEN